MTILGKVDDIQIVCEAKNGTRMIELVRHFQPQILLIDFDCLLKIDNWQSWIRTFSNANTRTLVINGFNLEIHLFELIQSGILGALSNDVTEEVLIKTIKKTSSGEIFFNKDLFDRAINWKESMTDKWVSMTIRERQILNMLNMGLSNKEIAFSIEISIKTVSFHLSNIYKKIGVKSRQEAASWVTKYLVKTQ